MKVSTEVLSTKLKEHFAKRENMPNPTERDRRAVANGWKLGKEFDALLKEERQRARNQQILADRERRSQTFSDFQLRLAAAYADRMGVAMTERNQEFCVMTAQAEYDQQLHEAKVAREAGKLLQEAYERDEAIRWQKLLTQPYPADGVGKDIMKWPLERLTDQQIDIYDGYSVKDRRQLLNYAIATAQQELFPVVFDTVQQEAIKRFMNAQVPPLSPFEPQNWIAAFKVLELEGAAEKLPTVKIDLSVPEPPPLPEKYAAPRNPNPHKPGSEAYLQWDRDQIQKGIDEHWDSQLGPALQEIATASGKLIPASLAAAVRDDLLAKNLPFTTYNIRRSFAYLRAGEIPANVYSQDELDQFEKDRQEELMSAEEYKKLNFRRRA